MDQDKLYEVTEEVIAEVKDKHPDVKLEQIDFVLDDGRVFECIVKKPSADSFQRYLATCNDKDIKDAGQVGSLQYIRDNIVAPSYEEFYRMIEDQNVPALATQVGNELAKGMGLTKKAEKKTI
jgi:hypothetical protein